jgi:hypothetical protein
MSNGAGSYKTLSPEAMAEFSANQYRLNDRPVEYKGFYLFAPSYETLVSAHMRRDWDKPEAIKRGKSAKCCFIDAGIHKRPE